MKTTSTFLVIGDEDSSEEDSVDEDEEDITKAFKGLNGLRYFLVFSYNLCGSAAFE